MFGFSAFSLCKLTLLCKGEKIGLEWNKKKKKQFSIKFNSTSVRDTSSKNGV